MLRPLSILLVEDSPDDSELLIRQVRRAGIQAQFLRVDTSEDMATALQTRSWDLVISDYIMPGFGGLEALALFKQFNLSIPFILVSGQIGEEIAVGALVAGASDYVLKDRLARLVPAIQRALDEAETRRARQRAAEELRQSEQAYRELAGKLIHINRELTEARTQLETRVDERTAELKAANISLKHQMDERKKLENELLEIVENERRRIGFDLHDDIGQRLMGVSMLVKALEHQLGTQESKAAPAAGRVSQLLDEVISHTQDLADVFNSRGPLEENIVHLIRKLLSDVQSTFGVTCRSSVDESLTDLPEEVVLQFYKITKEALSNAVKHGKATEIFVLLHVLGPHLILEIRNNGVPLLQTDSATDQFGFRIMEYRAHTLGGEIEFGLNGDEGTSVICRVPWPSSYKKVQHGRSPRANNRRAALRPGVEAMAGFAH